jgi:hypothetical protein
MKITYQIMSSSKTALTYVLAVVIVIIFAAPQIEARQDTLDIKGPVIQKGGYCGDFVINVKDDNSLWISQDTFHRDVGIIEPPVLLPGRYENFSEVHTSTFEDGKVNFEFSFRLSVLNKYEDAIAVFFVVDATTKNFTYDSVVYKAEKLQVMPNLMMFGNVFVNTDVELVAQIGNLTKSAIMINSIRLKNGVLYKIVDSPDSYNLETNDTLTIKINYRPITDKYLDLPLDIDTLIIETACLRYKLPISGIGVNAGIVVDDIDFGSVEVGSKVLYHESYNPIYGRGLRISNPGTGVLLTSGYVPLKENSPFKVSQPTNPNISTLEINPRSERFINGIRFEPVSLGEFFDTLTIKNNAIGPDSTCYIRGIAYKPGPHISTVNIGRVRVGDKKRGVLYLRNSGVEPVDVTGFQLSETSIEFRIIEAETEPRVSIQNPVRLYPDLPQYENFTREIAVTVEYTPYSEFGKEIKIFPEFRENSGILKGDVFNYVRGFGFKPAIEARGFTFPGKTLVSVQHPTNGKLEISSKSWSSNLFIKSIEAFPVGFTLPDEFFFGGKLPADTSINILQPLVIPVFFLPREAGDRQLLIRIISDAYTGVDGSKWDTTYINVYGTSYNKVLSVENVSLDSVFHCGIKDIYLKIKNISDSTEAFIDKAILIGDDINAFKIDTDSIDNNWVILNPKDSIYLRVSVSPESYSKNQFITFIRVFSDVDTSTGIIKVNTVKRDIRVDLPGIENTVPGAVLENNPPKSFGPDFEIKADFTNFKEIDVISFEIEIRFNQKYLFFANKINSGDLTSDWNELRAQVTGTKNGFVTLKLSGKGKTSLSGKSGVLCKPVFMVLLGDSIATNVQLIRASFATADRCMNIQQKDGQVRLSYCGDEVRKIILENRFYELRSGVGNFISENFAPINYTVAIDAPTYVEVFNSYGESVQIISNEFKSKGEYIHHLDVTNLSSGVYFVKMISGPYSNTIKLMLIR